jgi:hypothetical protein
MAKAGLRAVGFVVISGWAAVAGADEGSLPAAGSRVRLRVAGSGSIVGTLSAADDAYLTVVRPGEDRARVVARGDVARLERSVRPSRKGRGALIGLAVGFGAGFTFTAAFGNCSETGGFQHCTGTALAVYGAVTGAAAGAAGAGIGALVAPGERWAEAALPAAPAGPGARNGAVWRVVPLAGARRGALLSVSW